MDYYKSLFGISEPCQMLLNSEFWPQQLKVSEFDKANLVRDFDIQEIKGVIMNMKENFAPGPNGFGISFFRKFWDLLNNDISFISLMTSTKGY